MTSIGARGLVVGSRTLRCFAVVGLLLAGCSSASPKESVMGSAASARRVGPVGPERHTGPQGRVGQFVAKCGYSHSGPDDPIVHRGHHGASHRHDFYGATGTDATSTPKQLEAQPTTCDKQFDAAAYWHPSLYDGDTVVPPRSIAAYYRAAPGVDPTTVRSFPFGLAMIAGDARATSAQPGEAAGWTCGSSTSLTARPSSCPASAPLHLVLTFPDCWDGEHLDSADHRSHVAYSANGKCPRARPVSVPQLTMAVNFGISGDGHSLRLASGPVNTAHGDFLNAWNPAGLQREVAQCIHRDLVCDLASNREEESLFQVR